MVRRGISGLAIFLFFSAASFAVPDNNDERATKFAEAQDLARQGQLTQAISVYQALIKSHPLLPEAYNNLAALYLKQNDTVQAKLILEQGLHAHKGYGVLYKNLTAINVAMARDAYSKALQIDVMPSEINIATLGYDKNNQSRNTNTPVMAKVETPVTEPVIAEPVIAKPGIEEKVATVVNPSVSIEGERVENKLKLAPVPVSVPLSIPGEIKPVAVETVLQAWAAAWSAQAVDVYLSFYHQHYKPANGMSRQDWVQSRQYRLKKPSWIKIALSDLQVEKNTGKQAVVNFKQSYQSNTFNDISVKQMLLIYTDEGWRIYREKSL
ncbi:MAG: tetratricopeptide repeat protein [Gammaproteobacteria bacterium]|nr:tetratricopeptide repeat protein [Gammaproteobacteria bacterium]